MSYLVFSERFYLFFISYRQIFDLIMSELKAKCLMEKKNKSQNLLARPEMLR